MEAFRKADKDGSGFISALDFQDIMVSIKSHLLTKDVKSNLVAVSILADGCEDITVSDEEYNLFYILPGCSRREWWTPGELPLLHGL